MDDQIRPVVAQFPLCSLACLSITSSISDVVLGKCVRTVGFEVGRVMAAVLYFSDKRNTACGFSRGFSYAQLACYCPPPFEILLDVSSDTVAGVLAWLLEIECGISSRAHYECFMTSCLYRWLDDSAVVSLTVFADAVRLPLFCAMLESRHPRYVRAGISYIKSNLSSSEKSGILDALLVKPVCT